MKLRNHEYDPRFLSHMIYEGPPRDRIRLASQGSTVGHFNMDDIGWMKILKPPLVEQEKIIEGIINRSHSLELTIDRAHREIKLLHEYRTRLIADVVTGKLDVREAATKLPDEAEDSDDLLETDTLDDAKTEMLGKLEA